MGWRELLGMYEGPLCDWCGAVGVEELGQVCEDCANTHWCGVCEKEAVVHCGEVCRACEERMYQEQVFLGLVGPDEDAGDVYR